MVYSTFLGLQTALTGMRAGKAGLDTSSHNVSNANTEGYTRQRQVQQANWPLRTEMGFLGQGTEVQRVERLRESFLDTRVRTTQTTLASNDTMADLLQRAEDVLSEPTNGITVLVNELWDAWDDLALSPTDPAARQQVLAASQALANRFNTVASGWTALSNDTAQRITYGVVEANEKLARIAELNNTVASFGTALPPNDALDERDLLLDQLAASIGASGTVDANNVMTVTVGGTNVVAVGPPSAAETLTWNGGAGQYEVASNPGVALTVGGEMGGIRDFVVTTLPALQADFDQLALDLRDAVNTEHTNGFDLNGAAGAAFFAATGAADLAVAFTDPDEIAAAGAATGIHDGDNAAVLGRLRDATIDRDARAFVIDLGQQVASATKAADASEALAIGAQLARQSAHGVSLDEEMVSLVQYQRALEASSRVMTAVDQALDTLVNRTGVVGR